MKFYPIILGALFLSVPAHPINNDHLRCGSAIFFFGSGIIEILAIIDDNQDTSNFKKFLRCGQMFLVHTSAIGGCFTALMPPAVSHDKHKSNNKLSDKKSDEDKKSEAARFSPVSKKKRKQDGV